MTENPDRILGTNADLAMAHRQCERLWRLTQRIDRLDNSHIAVQLALVEAHLREAYITMAELIGDTQIVDTVPPYDARVANRVGGVK